MMKKLTRLLFILLITGINYSCDFINNTLTYKQTTANFVESLLEEDYDKAIQYMAMDHEAAKNTSVADLKSSFKGLRKAIVNNFGTELEYSFVNSEKIASTIEGESTAPNTTKAQIQYSNEKEFGVFLLTFDDHSNKILHIKILDVRRAIPNMIPFWLFGIIVICIPIFNIYVIREIRKSNLTKKWLKYLAVFCLNVPAITYTATTGLSFELLSLQILLGFSFTSWGYMGSVWTFGIPLGGIYWFLKTKKLKKGNKVFLEQNKIID
jgi:limonene-1,2-epoxide hydrolase